ncbi:hydrogenase small subunit [Geoalkalibacter sp.]|uniref:hydrogenase small subunit n=1 Tax=Geoalkalibacter sp. TaxID=3041440 RepID=UPI00272E0887|nr:hydrogenase small subunit [Geoalkalibacter sp.]
MKLTRRTFLKDAGLLLASLGLEPSLLPRMADALEEMASGRAPILWLQGLSCSGCSVSLLNSESPGPADLITRYLSLYFHQTLSAATGAAAKDAVETAIAKGGYILVVEGAVPLGVKEACKFADENFSEQLLRAARSAQAVVCTGTCAAFGGIPAAPPNLTGAAGVGAALKQAGLARPLINLPGCPTHPAWLVGTLLQVLKSGLPELDELQRPTRFFGQLLHEQCPLFAQYQKKHFAQALGEDGCLFKLGCQGVVTQADCSLRGWNGGVNWCIRGRSICIGCARPEFALDPQFAFFRLNENDLL